MANPTDPGSVSGTTVSSTTYLDRLRDYAVWAGTGITADPDDDYKWPRFWRAWTPRVYQNSVDAVITNNNSFYCHLGDLVVVRASFAIDVAKDQTGNYVYMSLPVTAANAEGVFGAGSYYDAGTAIYYMVAWPGTTTACAWATNGVGDLLGAAPSMTMAGGDIVRAHLYVEVA